MDGVVVNLRGCNASGKSTSVRKFIESFEAPEIISYQVSGNPNPSIVTKLGDGVYVLGRYDISSGGCDRYSGKTQIHSTIASLIKNEKPRVIVFEGFIFSKTANATVELIEILRKLHYEYKALFFFRDLSSIFRLLELRNGGSDYNNTSVLSGYDGTARAAVNLQKAGANVEYIYADTLKIEEMSAPIFKAAKEYL